MSLTSQICLHGHKIVPVVKHYPMTAYRRGGEDLRIHNKDKIR
jgi:hypothetical protein